MSAKFECFVEINHKRYTIVVDKEINAVNFGDVFLHFRKLFTKEVVSLDTHVFEIYDFGCDSYRRLSSFQTLVKCMSKIRVFLRKEGANDDKGKSSNFHCFDPKRLKIDTDIIERLKPLANSEKPKDTDAGDSKPAPEPLLPLFVPFQTSANSSSVPSKSEPQKATTKTKTSDSKTHNSSRGRSGSDRKRSSRKPRREEEDEFKSQGLVRTKDKKIECELCHKCFSFMTEAIKHIHSFEHMKNRREDTYEDIDKQFLVEIKDKNNLKYILSRKQELNKFNAKDKKQFIRHGIRVKDGFGDEAYVCVRCDLSFKDSDQMVDHFKHFLDVDLMRRNDSKDDIKCCDKSVVKVTKEKSRHKRKKNKSDVKGFRMPEEMVADVELLKRSGFCVIPRSRHKFVLRCRLCDISTKNISKAMKHIHNEDHNKYKTEMPFKGIDRLIVTESVNTADIEVVLARIEAVRELSYTLKEEFLSHGIKVKDGSGDSAYVCVKCNLLFDSQQSVRIHLESFDKLKNSLLNRTAKDMPLMSAEQIQLLEQQMSGDEKHIESLFRNEGIKYRKHDKSSAKQHMSSSSGSDDDIPDIYHYCLFCNTNFYSKETALYHINRPFHAMIKRGEYLSPIEAMFAVKTNRIDEFDIAFARMETLYRFDNKTKIDLKDKGIRLKDGIGAEAYVCLKCNASIASETIDSSLFAIIRHTNSREHMKYAIN